MKTEFTNLELNEIITIGHKVTGELIRGLETALLAERAERTKNPGVWDGAPDDATFAAVSYKDDVKKPNHEWMLTCKTYTRELPKTRAREIAENEAEVAGHCFDLGEIEIKKLANGIEAAILEYAESIK